MVLLLFLLLTGVVPVFPESTGSEVVEIDQQPEGSIAHPHVWAGAPPFNTIGNGFGGLTPPPPISSIGNTPQSYSLNQDSRLNSASLQASPAHSSPVTFRLPPFSKRSPSRSHRRKKKRKENNIFLNDPSNHFPDTPPIPQEPDIPQDEELDPTPKSAPQPNDIPPDSEEGSGTVYKHISVHVPPEDLDEEVSAPRVIKVAREPEKHLKVILIKPEPDKLPPKTEVELPPGPQQRTLVYVLSPSLGPHSPIKLIKPDPPKPVPPQVFFLRYTHKPQQSPPSPPEPVPEREREIAEPPLPETPAQPPIKQVAIPKKNAELVKPTPTAAIPPRVHPQPQIPLHIINSPVLYSPQLQSNYKILSGPARYQNPSAISHLANNLNNHHHNHNQFTPFHYHSNRIVVPRLQPHHYYNPYHHHHHFVSAAPISSQNHFPLYYHNHHDHNHDHHHHHQHPRIRVHHHHHPRVVTSPQYFPVLNTRFIYSATLFERR